MSYTNKGLVEYAKECLGLGDNSVYVYGAWGNKMTTSFCDSKHKQYPSINTKTRTAKYKKLCDGKHYAFDCVGLIKSFYWGGYGKAKYNSKTDVSANGMYNKAKVKGNISTIDKSRKGLLVQKNGHIGIYVGNNEVIECTIDRKAKQSHGLGGVCKTKLSDRKWEHWLECPYIDYVDEPKGKPVGTITVTSGSWNVREGAGVKYKVVRVVKGGTKLEYYGTENGWYKLSDGYISPKAVKTNSASSTTNYYKKCNSKYASFVDALKSIGVNSSFSNRRKIAKKNGISLYLGTANQNITLLEKLKSGKLIKA